MSARGLDLVIEIEPDFFLPTNSVPFHLSQRLNGNVLNGAGTQIIARVVKDYQNMIYDDLDRLDI